jgi:membrane protein DedA with SNARE-associated domain
MLPLLIIFKFSLRWLWHLGGPGLILLALLDNSLIPTPGGMDFATVLLSASHPDLWWYYGIMATAGSMIGGYLAYKVGREGGKEALDKRFGQQRLEKVYRKFEQAGFLTVFVPAILPPPFPTSYFLVAAGALDYPPKKFMVALGTARAIRYMGFSLAGFLWGRWIIHQMRGYYRPLLWIFTSLLIVSGVAGASYFLMQRRRSRTAMESSAKPATEKAA